MTRIVIVDDHPILLEGLRHMLSAEPDIEVAGQAVNAAGAIELAGRLSFDIMLLDLSLPDNSGFGVLERLKTERPGLRILILSAFPEEQFAVQAFKSGASGYVTKKSAAAELVIAIRKLARGGKYVSQALAEKLTSIMTDHSEKQPHEGLSSREFRILLMIASGKKTGEIAKELSISASTVGTYRGRILEKMHMKTTAELARYASENRLIE